MIVFSSNKLNRSWVNVSIGVAMTSDKSGFGNRTNRRRVLRSIGATGLGVGLMAGSAAGEEGIDPKDVGEEDFTGEATLDVDLEEAESKGPGVGILNDGENLEYFDDRGDSGTVSGTFGDILDVEWRVTAYEAVDDDGDPITDSDGDRYYVVEFYALSEEIYANSETLELTVDADFDSDSTLHGRDPETTSSVNGEWVTIRQSFSVDGFGISTDRAQYVNHGQWGPETWVPGDGGEYGVYFDGSTPDDQQLNWDIIGLCRLSYSGYAYSLLSLIDDWDGYAKGRRVPW